MGGLPVNRLWARENARQQRMRNTRNAARRRLKNCSLRAGEPPEPRPKALARAANDAADNLLIQYLLTQFTCPKGQEKDLDLSWPKS